MIYSIGVVILGIEELNFTLTLPVKFTGFVQIALVLCPQDFIYLFFFPFSPRIKSNSHWGFVLCRSHKIVVANLTQTGFSG
jgi:hypothetical protein